MRKEDLRISAGLTANMIARRGKSKHISMETLRLLCCTLNSNITDIIKLFDHAVYEMIGDCNADFNY